MKKQFCYIRWQNSGCDYTIGCGVDVEMIIAASKEDAIKQIIDLPDDWKEIFQNSKGDDLISESGLCMVRKDPYVTPIKNAILLEISEETDMMPILKEKLAEIESFKASIDNNHLEDIERKQYEKLKKKFEKK